MKVFFSGFEKDPRKSKFEINTFTPGCTCHGDYKVSGKLLLLPFVGSGNCNFTFGMLDFFFVVLLTDRVLNCRSTANSHNM